MRIILEVFTLVKIWCGLALWSFFIIHVCQAVTIRRLKVPSSIQNGTESHVILDCDYVYDQNDLRLVVKWFFDDNTEPVYQWIPGLNKIHVSGVLEGRIEHNFSISTIDSYARYRAVKILRPSIELSGKYTCLVTSLAGQDSKEHTMVVYAPAREFELKYIETLENTVNVSCEVFGIYPSPIITLYLQLSSGSPPQVVKDIQMHRKTKSTGAYDISLQRTFTISELPSKGGTVFECEMKLPGTSYEMSKRVAWYPGIQGLERSYGLSSSSLSIHCFPCYLLILYSILMYAISTMHRQFVLNTVSNYLNFN